MKLSLKAAALTAGVMWAGCMFIVGLIHLADPQYGAGFLTLMSSVYPGMHFANQWGNLVLGTIYGFVDGAIGGLIFAWIYDHLLGGAQADKHPAPSR